MITNQSKEKTWISKAEGKKHGDQAAHDNQYVCCDYYKDKRVNNLLGNYFFDSLPDLDIK